MICGATLLWRTGVSRGSAILTCWSVADALASVSFMLFTFVLPAGTIPGEESSPYLHSKAQGLSGPSCNQEGKRGFVFTPVVTSS